MRALGLIPARGGSQGVPGKNLRPLAGRPLLAYTARDALASGLDRVVLSTDDEAIATVGRELGLDVPFLRPAELATSEAPTLGVVRHAIDVLAAAGDDYDAVCLLQPTSPVRAPGLIDECLARLAASGADSVVTVRPVPLEFHPDWVYHLDADGGLALASGAAEPVTRRQDLTAAYHRDGAVYVTRTEVVQAGSLYGHRVVGVVAAGPSVNIDTEDDFRRAEALAQALGW
ncbi:MAG TPA: acylneuraminate cytidylyltransferase family protein [Acidimicrobiales bacterium]